MKSRKLLTSTVAAALVTTVATPAAVTQADTTFSDISNEAYYYEDVQWLVQQGIINGYEDGTYRPHVALTREEAASMFSRALKLDIPANAGSILEQYSDINAASWSAGALSAFIHAGISDTTGTQFNPKQPLTREVMASWLVGAFDFELLNNENPPFTDFASVGSDHLLDVKVLYQNGIVNGNTDGTYGPKDAVTRAQFASFMKRAMTSTESPDEVTPPVEEEEPDTPVVTEDLELEDAVSLNLKQVRVTANHRSYQPQDLNQTALYVVEDENGNDIKIVDVQTDGRDILLTLEKAVKGDAKLIVDEQVTGREESFRLSFSDSRAPELVRVTPTSQYSFLLTFSEPLDFGVDNGKDLTSSRFLDSLEIDGDLINVDKMTVQKYGQEIHVESEYRVREGEHEIELVNHKDYKDYADNQLEDSTFDFTMKYDTTAPELLEVKNVSTNQVTLVFDKQIKLRYRGYLYHTSTSHYPSSASVQNGNELVLTFDTDDLIKKSTDFTVDNGAVEDLWGNKNTKMTKAIEISDDTTPPSITNIEFMDGTIASGNYIQMKVSFSESVKTDRADDINNYELVDELGKTIAIRDIQFEDRATNEQVATFTIDRYYGDVPIQRFTLEADELEDLVGNEATDVEYSFTASSEKPPGDFEGKFVLNEDEDEVLMVVDFGRSMATSGSYAVNTLDKYQLTVKDETVLVDDLQQVDGFDVSIEMYQDAERLEILLRKTGDLADKWDDFFEDLVDAIDYGDVDDLELVVARVADEGGNRTTNIVNDIELAVQSGFDKSQVTAEAVAEDTVVLQFDDEIVNFDEDDFTIFYDRDGDKRADSNEDLEADVSISTTNGKSVVTFKLDEDDELDSDARYNNDLVYIETEDEDDMSTENRYGQKVEINNLLVEDGIAPKIYEYRGKEQVYVQPVKNDSEKAIVTLELTDDIDKDTLTRLSFVIGDGDDYEIESVFVENDDTIGLVVDLDGNKAKDLVGEYVKQKAAISDDSDNIITDIDVRIYEERSSREKP